MSLQSTLNHAAGYPPTHQARHGGRQNLWSKKERGRVPSPILGSGWAWQLFSDACVFAKSRRPRSQKVNPSNSTGTFGPFFRITVLPATGLIKTNAKPTSDWTPRKAL